MTSSGHVTSSVACAIDSPYASSYWLYIETPAIWPRFRDI